MSLINQNKTNAERSELNDIELRLADARRKTWEAVEAIAKAIHPGMNESAALKLAQKTLAGMGSRKFWHKCHVRFGANTVLSFDDPYKTDVKLGKDDIFYIDIGPIWDGIEGDAGATFVVGSDTQMTRCKADALAVFEAVKNHWQTQQASGQELYQFASEQAEKRGWILAPSYVQGHRLSEFPHSFHTKLHVAELDFCPAPQRWVLEIQICDPKLKFGAFYEDIL